MESTVDRGIVNKPSAHPVDQTGCGGAVGNGGRKVANQEKAFPNLEKQNPNQEKAFPDLESHFPDFRGESAAI
jgi:hypothetical protein